MNRYIKPFYWLSFVLVGVLVLSCSEDTMDDINKNPNNPADVAAKFLVTQSILNTSLGVAHSDLNYYASVYIEHHVGTGNQMNNAEIRSGEPYSPTTYNNSWNAAYDILLNLKVAINKCSDTGSGEEPGNYHVLGVAQILSAYNLAILTDNMGDIPWAEALQPGVIFTPKVDKQEAVYVAINKFLDDGITNLSKTIPSEISALDYSKYTDQDILYKGDASKWLKFANGLKMRYKMRLSLRSADYNGVIELADKSFTSAADEAAYKFNGSSAINPIYKFYTSRDYFGASQSLHDKLVDRNDPRDKVYFSKHPKNSILEFAPNGLGSAVANKYGISGIMAGTRAGFFLSYQELCFLKAEAYARLGTLDKAEDELKKGITAAFEKVGLDTTAAATYYTNDVKAKYDSNPLNEVMMQKYLAFYEDESLEAYADYRRMKAMGNGDYLELKNPNPFPLRFTYGNSDVLANPNVKTLQGDGQYVKTENVWWAGGTR